MFVEGEGVYTELSEDGKELVTPVAWRLYLYPKVYTTLFIQTVDSKAIALITKKWNDCDEPLTRVDNV